MNFKSHIIILAVIESLRKRGSWTGKTHVQKALSILRDSGKTTVPFHFVLYKHGPYSFELESELEQMQSYGAVAIDPNPEGYGVTLKPAKMAKYLREVESLSDEERQAIDEICTFVGARNVADLERLATASWIRCQESVSRSTDVAKRLHALKPHIPIAEAEKADREVYSWLAATK